MRTIRHAFGAALLLEAAVSGASHAQQLLAQKVERWLLCEECFAGELDSVVRFLPGDSTRRDSAVTRLAAALGGPSADQQQNIRMQMTSSYDKIVRAARGAPLPVSEADYVAGYVANFVALYERRAAVALGRIATPAARAALQNALANDSLYRSDVLRVIRTALGLRVGINGGNGQTATIGQTVPTAPSVIVRDGSGAPLSRIFVLFRPAGRGAAVTDSVALTDVSGIATVGSWTLGADTGRVTLLARADDSSVTFRASALPSSQTPVMVISAGNNQRAAAGVLVAVPPAVLVTDGFGKPKEGTTVTFSAGASVAVTGPSQVTNTNGIATVGSWRLRPARGPDTLVAASPGVPSVTFRATATAPWVSVVDGVEHGCALAADSAAYCWGRNDQGQLGDSSTISRRGPRRITRGLVFASLASSSGVGHHSCGVTTSGTAYCWGSNDRGELGDSTNISRNQPTPVSGGLVFRSLAVGGNHTCGVTADSSAYCWGDNSSGQLGDGTTAGRIRPVAVGGQLQFLSVTAGAFHTCGRVSPAVTGRVFCWGRNDDGQLGDRSTIDRLVPTLVFSPQVPFRSISAGGFHTCGVRGTDIAVCWGLNDVRQLGDSSVVSDSVPRAVPGVGNIVLLSAGWKHTCGIASNNGPAYCWGANTWGTLGDGSSAERRAPVAVVVPSGVAFVTIGAGDNHTCGVTARRDVYCWGRNNAGQLGDGSLLNRAFPRRIAEP